MKENNIDYSKLNDRIVEQAWRSALPSVLDEEDVKRLVADKLNRAKRERDTLVKQGLLTE
jgi:hypothetical protein